MLSTPTAAEKAILDQVGLRETEEYGVLFRDGNTIRLLHYRTRDVIIIHRGDRPWPKE